MSMVKLAITPEDTDDSAEELPLPPAKVIKEPATPAEKPVDTADRP